MKREADSGSVGAAGRADLRRVLKVFAFVVLAGPLLGALVFVIPMLGAVIYEAAFTTMPDARGLYDTVLDGLALVGFLFVFGYIFGAIGAIISATVLSLSLYRWGDIGLPWILATSLVSAVIRARLMDVFSGQGSTSTLSSDLSVAIAPALVAAVLGWLIMRKFGWIGQMPKSSFTEP